MGNIYGRPQAPPKPPSLVTAVPSLQEQLSILEKRRAHVEKLAKFNEQKARESKDKQQALRYLKLRNMYNDELKTIFGMLDKLENLDSARQRLHFQKDMLEVTKHVTTVIKKNTIDEMDAEEIMNDAADLINDVKNVSDVLSRTEEPSDELEQQLNELMEETMEQQILSVPLPDKKSSPLPSFPAVPTHVPEMTSMEKELEALAL